MPLPCLHLQNIGLTLSHAPNLSLGLPLNVFPNLPPNLPMLQGCTASIHAGEFVVLTGASGSGKSLLLRIIAGLVVPTLGKIIWVEKGISRDFSAISPQLWRSQIGFIQQTPELINGTVLDNLRLPFGFKFYQNRDFNPDWHSQQLRTLNKPADFLQKNSATLSGGEKQLVNILRCLQLNPQLLLLDEPTAALDSTSRDLVENLVAGWQRQDPSRAIVWISHDSEQQRRFIKQGATHWFMASGHLANGGLTL